MRYFIRAVKCFVYYALLFFLIMVVLHFMGSIDITNLAEYFRDGYNSLWQIAGFLALISAIYPKFSYMRRVIPLKDGVDARASVTGIMAEFGYAPERKVKRGAEDAEKKEAGQETKRGAEEGQRKEARRGAEGDSGTRSGEILVFRAESSFTKIVQMGEDGISVAFRESEIEVEGRRRNVVRAISRIEYRMGK